MKNVNFVLKMTVFQGFVDMIVHLFSLPTPLLTLCLTSILSLLFSFACQSQFLHVLCLPIFLSQRVTFVISVFFICSPSLLCFFSFSSSSTNCCTVLCLPLYLFPGHFISLYLEVFLKFHLPIHLRGSGWPLNSTCSLSHQNCGP